MGSLDRGMPLRLVSLQYLTSSSTALRQAVDQAHIGPFEAGQHVDDGPAFAFFADDLVGGHMHIIQVDFIVNMGAVHVGDAFDGDARGSSYRRA